jgi:hypothetical protein
MIEKISEIPAHMIEEVLQEITEVITVLNPQSQS